MIVLPERKSNLLIELYGLTTGLLIIVTLFFHTAIANVLGLPNLLDEAAIGLALIFLSFKAISNDVARHLLLLFFASLFFFTAISVESMPRIGLLGVVIQNVIHLKFIVIFGFLWCAVGPSSVRLTKFVLLSTIAFLFLNFIVGDVFNHLLNVVPNIRGGYLRPIGIQGDTAGLGLTFAFTCVYFLLKDDNRPESAKLMVLLGFVILILLSSVRSGLIVLPIIAAWWMRSSMGLALALMFVLSVAVFFSSGSPIFQEMVEATLLNIEYTVESPKESGYIRGIMIYFSVILAIDRFPFGVGAGSYGTVMSDNSPVYTELGLQNSLFFINKEGIYDSNLASLLGEFGVIGLLVYALVVYLTFTAPFRLSQGDYRWSPSFKFGFFCIVFAYCIPVPLFMNSYPAAIMGLIGVAAYYSSKKASVGRVKPVNS